MHVWEQKVPAKVPTGLGGEMALSRTPIEGQSDAKGKMMSDIVQDTRDMAKHQNALSQDWSLQLTLCADEIERLRELVRILTKGEMSFYEREET